jgi:transcriptional regulator with XRE-family HTH domain
MKVTRLRAERLKRKWTQTYLAYHARLAVSDISKIETGRTIPYPLQLERLARVLNIEPDKLMEKVDI